LHETHLIQPIIQGIAAHAQKEGAHAVLKVRLKIGDLMGVSEDSFKATFSILAKDTLLENADLDLTFFPGTQIEVLSFDID
jgi:Zn finger protein HypA/HybF involved in hydrogenase expression